MLVYDITISNVCIWARLRFTGAGEVAFDCDATTRLRFLIAGVFRADISFESLFAAMMPARCSDTRRRRLDCICCCDERSRLDVGARVRTFCTHASVSSECPSKKHASKALRFISFLVPPHSSSSSSGTKVEAHNVSCLSDDKMKERKKNEFLNISFTKYIGVISK